ncbi:unnamed protein product [Citrullus colocynthis]|uniref:Uncharacterized protein n=1 Tax=Citrullus colocynthis TaxID=252529 RepID=A0ABP0Z8M4_9ROSI
MYKKKCMLSLLSQYPLSFCVYQIHICKCLASNLTKPMPLKKKKIFYSNLQLSTFNRREIFCSSRRPSPLNLELRG